ncbi:MAG: glycosyltransferase family 4 protein [Gammaproteobacteria bacterium]|jgi:glycosyltransferase involved in cell wall biosynthesis|nr:glycosyltransferase family 4 protein [Gammaproteobacteria bacterium]MBP6050510.1 glycosyltransferase family 4 protein [Pseudomonadales bacterium]MBK6583571.1 glycosyltransferase family 4 protein [Gammaproteobacteria bacterium]MBK7169923.1 glycosyltransferase family 4 protein [Gammaproteobacteria bacterium]MBK7727617.1 glycosyltransferase family 4 protein [Gammaproteobacteria bacterium]
MQKQVLPLCSGIRRGDGQSPLENEAVIAVDVTPLLPGGGNGGAKVFVCELLPELGRLAPCWKFVLLTRAESHGELAGLDASNIERLQVLEQSRGVVADSLVFKAWKRLLPYLPTRVKHLVVRMGACLRRRQKRPHGRSLLRESGADLLFCPFGATVYAVPGVPAVSTIHDLQYKSYPQFFAAEEVAHRDYAFVTACREATRLVAISEYTRRSAIHHGKLGEHRIRTIPHRLARRLGDAASGDPSLLLRLGLGGTRYLVYPANFWKHKNHELLLTAFGVAASGALPADVRLVCTGAAGDRCDFLMNAARTMGLQERILFPGYLSTAELAALMRGSLGMVFPSLYEGFGLPVLEAMDAGVPVACSNATSLPEVAAGAAILFDPGSVREIADAILLLATDATVAEDLVRAGRLRAAGYSDTRQMANDYLVCFGEAMSLGRTASQLVGVYADNWVGNELELDVVAPGENVQLRMELVVPDWIPHKSVDVELRVRSGMSHARHIRLRRGESRLWSVPVSDGLLDVCLKPSFVPALCGHGEDPRELTLKLKHCSVRRDDGDGDLLWGESQG